MNKIEKTSSTTKENKTSPTDVILTERYQSLISSESLAPSPSLCPTPLR